MTKDKINVVGFEKRFYHNILNDDLDDYKTIKLNQLLSHDEKLKLVEENDYDISSTFTRILANIYVHILNMIIIILLLGTLLIHVFVWEDILMFFPLIALIILVCVAALSHEATEDDTHSEKEYQEKKLEKRKRRQFRLSKNNKKQINEAVDQYEKSLLSDMNQIYIDPETKIVKHKYDFIKRVEYGKKTDYRKRVKYNEKNDLKIQLHIPLNYISYNYLGGRVSELDKKALYEVGKQKHITLIDLLKQLQFIYELNKKQDRIKLIDDSYMNLKEQEENVYELNRRIDEYMKINNIDY